MNYLMLFSLLCFFSKSIEVPAAKNVIDFKQAPLCTITFNPSFTPSQLIDEFAKCIESNPTALEKLLELAALHDCDGPVRHINLCIIRHRGTTNYNLVLEIFVRIQGCAGVLILDSGTSTGIAFAIELLHCLGILLDI